MVIAMTTGVFVRPRHPPAPPAMSEETLANDDSAVTGDARDLELMHRVKGGDMAAFQSLVEIHQFRVVGTISKMLGGDLDAEDLAQQVFIRVWNSAARYQPSAKFTTWLFTITRNLVFNEIRRRQRHPSVSLDQAPDDDHPAFEPRDPSAPTPAASLLDREMEDAIQKAIDSLPETQRMAVVLRRYEDMAYEEIGEVLGLTVPAVKSVLFRARTELRERLQQYLDN